ncbi:MAG: hypothetical protein ACRDLF_08750 [Solirubrobacteraceae bacterium]
MTRHRITVFNTSKPTFQRTPSTLGLGVAVGLAIAAFVPAGALAGGPLLSGYGGPGAGAQAIIGATLLNGPGSSGGSSGGGGPAGGSSANGPAGGGSISSRTAAGAASSGGGGGTAANTSAAGGAKRAHGGSAQAAGAGSSGASSGSLQKESPAASVSPGASWFSGGDLLALVLAAGALALTAVATVRLARSQHD